MRSTFATASKMKPVASESAAMNMSAAARMAVGNRGTRPVVKYSVTTGMPAHRPLMQNSRATSEKNYNGRKSLNRVPIMAITLSPSLTVFNFETEPSGRSRYSTGTSAIRQRRSTAWIDSSVSI